MIGIVILNYNQWKLTENCVDNIRETCNSEYKIYIVDNASTMARDSKFDQRVLGSDCCLLQNRKNAGYAGGNNIGIRKALNDGCQYILISNNDVIFNENSIVNLARFLKDNPEYGIAGPKVFLPDGTLQEINMGCKMTLIGKYKYILRKTPFRFWSKKFVDKFHCMDVDRSMPIDVYAVSGCCFMMTSEVTKLITPLDENTFLFEEENIIGCRMERIKKLTSYCVFSEVVHLGGGSMQGMSAFAYNCFIQSEKYYCREYLHANFIQVLPLLLLRYITFIKKYGLRDYLKYCCRRKS